MAEPVILERMTRVAPLGLRFWDGATGQIIPDGLQVQATPKLVSGVYTGSPAAAIANRTGTYLFNHLPGLQESEFGAGDQAYWQSPPAKKDYIISVADTLRRFLPFSFTASAPTQKILAFACASGKPTPLPALQPAGSIPLYSAPGRAVPGGCAVIRARLARNPSQPEAVPYALVEAYVDGAFVARGLSDQNGSLALYFAYPQIVLQGPMSSRPPLTQTTWPVDINVFSSLSPPGTDPPDLCGVFDQPAATPLRQLAPNKPLQTQTLTFGQELVLKTSNRSELFLS